MSGEDEEAVRRLHERLTRLVATSLDIIDDERTLPPERLEEIRVDALLSTLGDVFSWRAREKDQTLHVDAGSDDLRVSVVPELLRDCIVANLVSNALKFSPPGTEIDVKAERRGDRVAIEVRDGGEGFPPDVAERLARGDRIPSREGTQGETGLGLGLTLCREYARRMSGELEIGGSSGGGVATVSFPSA
jgi:signal transduction histidine kinase